jgi:dolichyl-diphosphooligosaccharide--protein glycosyltransferase
MAEEVKIAEAGESGNVAAPAPTTTKDTLSNVQDKAKLLEESKQRSLDVIAGTQSLLIVVILVLACIVAFSSRLFAVIRFESIIHEFDPWWVHDVADM